MRIKDSNRMLLSSISLSIFCLVLMSFDMYSWASSDSQSTKRPPKTLVLSSSEDTKNTYHGRWLKLIYTEALNRIGVTLEYKGLPLKRATHFAVSGKTDGEIHRVSSYAQKHPSMVIVPEPHFSLNFSAFAAKPINKLNGWSDLKNFDGFVSYRRGVKMTTQHVPKWIKPSKIVVVNSTSQGLAQLKEGRTQLHIGVGSVIDEFISQNDEFARGGIYRVGVMQSVIAHAFLHPKNKKYAQPIADALKAMKAEGLIEEYAIQAK